MAKEPAPEPFERLYARLEGTVAKLEEGGMPLEEAIALYEAGMTLARACQDRLDEAELKITRLKESFAPLPERADGARLQDDGDATAYVADDSEPAYDDDPFE